MSEAADTLGEYPCRTRLPLVTVVTVCWNAGREVQRTMESVFCQTYPAIEYIVVDGGSTDDSLSCIKRESDRLAHWVSEPDKGIYDAMNKGIARANGDWIIFMNAGDGFVSPHAVQQAISAASDDVDFIYGEVDVVHAGRRVRMPTRPLDLMWQRISFSHQALFSRTLLMKESPFNCSYAVAADYEFYFKLFSRGARFRFIPAPIAYISTGGFSEKLLWRRTFERWHIARTHRRVWETDLFYLKFIARNIIPETARRQLRRLGLRRTSDVGAKR